MLCHPLFIFFIWIELYQLLTPAQEPFKAKAKKPHILRNKSPNIIQQYHMLLDALVPMKQLDQTYSNNSDMFRLKNRSLVGKSWEDILIQQTQDCCF